MTTITAPRALTLGAVAGPLWVTVSLAQAVFRSGYDITRQPLSMLSNGSLGWLQILNFIVAGVLCIAGASAQPTPWSRRLLFVNGIGLTAAGIFVMDAGQTLTWRGIGHMAAGTLSFTALIAACYVLARHFLRSGKRSHAVTSIVAGTALLAGDLWAMSGGVAGSLTLGVGAITAMLWTSYVAAITR